MNKINEIGDTPKGREWLGAVQARAKNRRDRARLNAEIPKSEREKESRKQQDIMDRANDTAHKNTNTSKYMTQRQLLNGANKYYRKNNYHPTHMDWDEYQNESKEMNRIKESSGYNELKMQAIDRFREQDPMTLSNSELRSAIDYMLAYRWALDGNEDVLHEYIKAAKLKNEGKTMNKKLIRLTESDLHKIVKQSVGKILKEGTTNRGVTEMWYQAQEMMGADSMLDALYAYLDTDTIEGFVQTLRREYELPLGNY